MQPNAIIAVLALSLFSSHAAGADLADDLLGVWRLKSVTQLCKRVNSASLWASDLQALPPSHLVVTSRGNPLRIDVKSSQ
jgi:hypothetical protein